MSRKHEIDVSHGTAHISIFGGKLTDCVNVGNEVAGYVSEMGVRLDNRITSGMASRILRCARNTCSRRS